MYYVYSYHLSAPPAAARGFSPGHVLSFWPKHGVLGASQCRRARASRLSAPPRHPTQAEKMEEQAQHLAQMLDAAAAAVSAANETPWGATAQATGAMDALLAWTDAGAAAVSAARHVFTPEHAAREMLDAIAEILRPHMKDKWARIANNHVIRSKGSGGV